MMSEKGKIMFVSENVEKHIGYNQVNWRLIVNNKEEQIVFIQIELVGTSISDILHPGDNTKFHSYICSSSNGADGGDISSSSPIPSPSSSLMSPSPSSSTSSSESTFNDRGPR